MQGSYFLKTNSRIFVWGNSVLECACRGGGGGHSQVSRSIALPFIYLFILETGLLLNFVIN